MFIKNYNSFLKSLSKKINIETKLLDESLNIETLESLMEIDFSNSLSFNPFTVLEEILQNSENENWIAFAEYIGYEWYYTVDLLTNEVFLIDIDTNQIDMYCAKDFYSFIKAMSKVIEMETLYHSNGEDFTDAILPKYYSECLEIAGGNFYESFYRQILGFPPADSSVFK